MLNELNTKRCKRSPDGRRYFVAKRLIACEQTNRICRTIELDEKYCDVIVKRYIEQVGSTENVFVIREGESIPFDNLETMAHRQALQLGS